MSAYLIAIFKLGLVQGWANFLARGLHSKDDFDQRPYYCAYNVNSCLKFIQKPKKTLQFVAPFTLNACRAVVGSVAHHWFSVFFYHWKDRRL